MFNRRKYKRLLLIIRVSNPFKKKGFRTLLKDTPFIRPAVNAIMY